MNSVISNWERVLNVLQDFPRGIGSWNGRDTAGGMRVRSKFTLDISELFSHDAKML